MLEIDESRGVKRIDSLGLYPLAYHEEMSVREKRIRRGGRFGSLKSMYYNYNPTRASLSSDARGKWSG